MRLSKIALAALLPSVILAGCGGEEKRSTSGSSDLTGLWRTTLKSAQIGLDADSNISYLLEDTANGLFMTSCINRSKIQLNREGNTISGLPVGDTTIINNDRISGSGEFGNSKGSKIALPLVFDMGSLSVSGSGFGSRNFSDLCVISSDAKVLGVTTYEEYSAGTIYNGETLEFRMRIMDNVGLATYPVEKEPVSGQASIVIKSEGLKDNFNRTEMTLRNGTVTITENTNVWIKGNYTGYGPEGNQLSGSFELEKP